MENKIDQYFNKKKQSEFQTKINKIINDAKHFNEKIDFYIKKTEYEKSRPKVKFNKGTIRKMIEQDLESAGAPKAAGNDIIFQTKQGRLRRRQSLRRKPLR